LAGKTLQNLQTSHEGKGLFKHTPLAGQEYFAKFVLANGDSVVSKLPKAQETGFVLSINEVNDSIKIKVYGNYLENKKFYLIGQQEGDVFCEAAGNLQKGAYSIALAKQNLPQGISQITLFDETGKPHCERLFFVNQQDFLNINLKTDKTNYKPKEKVNAEITVTDKAGQAMEGIFSVSVTDADLVKYDKFSENINSYFALSSELEKYTSQANYYLQNNEEAKKNLDLLLLINGWRRYKWKDILENPMPKRQYSVEQSFYLSGKITNQSEKKPLSNSTVTVLTNGKLYATEADSLGKFDLNIGTWKDSTKVLVQCRNKKGNQYVKISLDKKDTPSIEQLPFDLFPSKNSWNDNNNMKILAEKSRQSQVLEANFRMLNGTILLNEVTVEGKKTPEEKVEAKIRNMSLHKYYTRKIDGKDLPEVYLHPLEALQGRTNLQVIKDDAGMVTGVASGRQGGGGIIGVFLLDGMRVPIEIFMGMAMSTIERIEIVSNPQAIYGLDGNAGAIAIYTKVATNESYSSYENPGLSQRMMTGFYQAKEFYMPNYEQKDLELNTPDIRVTVYWNGKIKTDKNGKAKFSFFCAENGKKYNLNIEGKAKHNQLTGVANSEIIMK
jgi:hypothetical protein